MNAEKYTDSKALETILDRKEDYRATLKAFYGVEKSMGALQTRWPHYL